MRDLPTCREGEPRRCGHALEQPPRIRVADGGALIGMLSIGSLATHTVVHAAQVITVPSEADPTATCLLGCGVSTGIGAVVNTAALLPGTSVAVIGLEASVCPPCRRPGSPARRG